MIADFFRQSESKTLEFKENTIRIFGGSKPSPHILEKQFL